MSNLSFENIDRWLFEYTEGNLSPDQVSQLEYFLSIHPELQLELDAWNSAKVTPEAEVAVNVAALQKSYNVWPLISTIFIALLGIGAFFYLYDFTADTKYAQKSIDLEMIGDYDNDFVFSGKTNFSKEENEGVNKKVSSENLVSSDKGTSIPLHIASTSSSNFKEKNKVVSNYEGLNVNQIGSNISTSSQNFMKEGSLTSSFENDLTSWLFEAPELERVKYSLNNGFTDNNELALQASNVKTSTTKTKSTFSRKAKSMIRKVQRMMDQPIALRNFKDPHYAIPNLSSYQANFGMAGTMIQHRFQATSRNQWVGRENQQLMNRIAWDGYIRPLRGGVGIDLNYNDFQDGSIKDMSFGLTYSPKFSVSKNVSFEPAVRFKMGMTDYSSN